MLSLFEIKHLSDEIKPQNLVLFSDKDYFYCQNCIFGYKITNGMFTIFANTIDYIISSTMNKFEDLKCDKHQICFELPKGIKDNYIAYSINFKCNNSTKVLLEKKYKTQCHCQLILTISKDKKISAKKLSDLALTIYEILMIYFGVGMKIISRTFDLDNKKINFYTSVVDKYSYGVKNSISFSNFIMLDNNSLNKEIIQKYNNLKKETLILCDVYFTIINSDTYREIKLNMILQCIEGFYKSIYGKNKNYKFWEILENVFLINPYCKRVLSKTDKRKFKINNNTERVFLYKAKNHRNYFSHLNINERKKVFEKMQINYAYWKVILTFRLLLLEYLGITYEKNLLIEIIKNINDYKKTHKIRLNVLK